MEKDTSKAIDNYLKDMHNYEKKYEVKFVSLHEYFEFLDMVNVHYYENVDILWEDDCGTVYDESCMSKSEIQKLFKLMKEQKKVK